MKFLVLLLCLQIIWSLSEARKLSFKDCGSKVGKLVSFDLSPCSQDPCIIKRGSNATGTVTFIPSEEVTSSKVYMYAIIGFIPVPLPLPNTDGCKGYGLTCPLKSGKPDELVFSHSIDSTFPAGTVTLKGELKDQEENNIFCGKISLTLQ
uniref:Niemann-Pick C 2 Like n=1 Tax=Anemonia viridis TaxID=51769 RepID=W0Z6N1_ANEVI|nr:Niemann-Pick C 2 Like [Anemonia viridis]CDJ70588.1 Niemann-Pick C 2 Like [Anemonia viridis]